MFPWQRGGFAGHTLIRSSTNFLKRYCCDGSTDMQLAAILKKRFPHSECVIVNDISAPGCGAMFEIKIAAPDFAGLSRVKQHQLITEALASEIRNMHGLRIHTTVTSKKS